LFVDRVYFYEDEFGFMLYMEFAGGLGNQMFQYAFYRRLKEMGKEVKCVITNDQNSNRPFCLDIFPNVQMELISDTDDYYDIKAQYLKRGYVKKIINRLFPATRRYYFENENTIIDNDAFILSNKIISGYFQGIEYVKPIESIIKNEFKFPVGEPKLANFIDDLPKDAVSIHIRRGDYLELSDIYGGICTKKYYSDAIEYMRNNNQSSFIVLSNDQEWVKKNIVIENAVYIEKTMFDYYQDWYDMCIMSCCKNNIIANSSFSWWGAWLNNNVGKKVILPPFFDHLHEKKRFADNGWTIVEG
jgi:hypothetical protein